MKNTFNTNEKYIVHHETESDSWNDTFSSKTAAIKAARASKKKYDLTGLYVYRATGFQNVGTYMTVRVLTLI